MCHKNKDSNVGVIYHLQKKKLYMINSPSETKKGSMFKSSM